MDRIHRIGQTKPVTIYRLLMKDTIEEKIVGLQQFKIDMMNSIITRDNSNIDIMLPNSILDIFIKENKTINNTNDKKTVIKKCIFIIINLVYEYLDNKEAKIDEYNDLELSNFLSDCITDEIEELITK